MSQSNSVFLNFRTSPTEVGLQRIVPDRVTPLIELSRNKAVLNIGCCGSDALTSLSTVHSKLSQAAAYCLGIDIFEEGILKLRTDGENVILANAETFDLPDKNFDLVVLGDVIEHVANPGLVLDNANRHLVDGGIIAVTTPNPFALERMLHSIYSKYLYVNSEHVCWFDPVLLSYLLRRSQFDVAEVFWTDYSARAPIRWLQTWRRSFLGTFGIVAIKSGPTRRKYLDHD